MKTRGKNKEINYQHKTYGYRQQYVQEGYEFQLPFQQSAKVDVPSRKPHHNNYRKNSKTAKGKLRYDSGNVIATEMQGP